MKDYDKPVTTPEPADGAKVAVYEGDGWKVIHRDDARADQHSDHATERWFDTNDQCEDDDGYTCDDDGRTWQSHLKYAEAVYPLDEATRIEVTR